MMRLGRFVCERRKELNISAAELVRRTDISRTYLWNIERGESDNVTIGMLRRLAKGLDISLSKLFLAIIEDETDTPENIAQLWERWQ